MTSRRLPLSRAVLVLAALLAVGARPGRHRPRGLGGLTALQDPQRRGPRAGPGRRRRAPRPAGARERPRGRDHRGAARRRAGRSERRPSTTDRDQTRLAAERRRLARLRKRLAESRRAADRPAAPALHVDAPGPRLGRARRPRLRRPARAHGVPSAHRGLRHRDRRCRPRRPARRRPRDGRADQARAPPAGRDDRRAARGATRSPGWRPPRRPSPQCARPSPRRAPRCPAGHPRRPSLRRAHAAQAARRPCARGGQQGRPWRTMGHPVGDRPVRVRRPEPAAQQRRRLGLLPDDARDLGGPGWLDVGVPTSKASKAEQDRLASKLWNNGAGLRTGSARRWSERDLDRWPADADGGRGGGRGVGGVGWVVTEERGGGGGVVAG